MKKLLFLSLVATLVGCSGDSSFKAKPPRPVKSETQPMVSEPTPVVATPEVLNGAPLVMPEETVVKIEHDVKQGTVSIPIKNIDPEAVYTVTKKMEMAETFSLPSKKTEITLAPLKSDEITVQYNPGPAQLTRDNLIVTYVDPKTGLQRSISHPITVIRLPKKEVVVDKVISVVVKNVNQDSQQDFGKTMLNEPISSKVIVQNVGNEDALIDIKVSKNDNFKIESNECPEVLKVKEECALVVAVKPTTPGIYQDEIVVKYSSTDRTINKVTQYPLLAEKIEDLKLCGGQPCAEPLREGVLISSQVFSNEVNFGTIRVGSEATKQVEIQNLGDTSLKVKTAEVDGNGVFSFAGGTYPGTKGTCGEIILKGSCVLDLSYIPISPGSDEGSFKIETEKRDRVVLKLVGKGKEDKKCETFNEYLVVPMSSNPASQVIFPYLKKAPGTTAALSTLYGKEVNSRVAEIGEETVKDGQVYTTFKLPKMEGTITDMSFGVNVFKVIRDNFKDTESLCISSKEVRKCSGERFHLASWEKLRNPKFWDQFASPVNQRYEAQFANGEKKCGPFNCMDLKTRYELKDIFDLTEAELAKIMSEGTFSLIFSDDTRMLKMPRIEVRTKVISSCD